MTPIMVGGLYRLAYRLLGSGLPKEPASPPVKETCKGVTETVTPSHLANKKAALTVAAKRLVETGRQSRPRHFHGAEGRLPETIDAVKSYF